jgi:hypothetical protein
MSPTVVDLVAGSGIAFADRGTHALKSVPKQWQLFVVKDLPLDGSGLRVKSAANSPTNGRVARPRASACQAARPPYFLSG